MVGGWGGGVGKPVPYLSQHLLWETSETTKGQLKTQKEAKVQE